MLSQLFHIHPTKKEKPLHKNKKRQGTGGGGRKKLNVYCLPIPSPNDYTLRAIISLLIFYNSNSKIKSTPLVILYILYILLYIQVLHLNTPVLLRQVMGHSRNLRRLVLRRKSAVVPPDFNVLNELRVRTHLVRCLL